MNVIATLASTPMAIEATRRLRRPALATRHCIGAHILVRCLTEGVSVQMTCGGRRHDKIVSQFQEYLEAHADKPLYLSEICAATSTSERTLRIACEEHLGMGPIRYLALRRMHLERTS
jgi:transcriptional regulator GlxA family with amidase domain